MNTDEAPDQQAVVRNMRFVADAFYNLCQARGLTHSGVDGFFSLCALISKYVSVYEDAVLRGDQVLWGGPVRAGAQHIEYIAEKFARAFGPLIGLPATLHMFVEKLRSRAAAERSGRTRYVASGGPPSDHLVSSAHVEAIGTHELVRLWTRGGIAGELMVSAGDGARLAAALGLTESNAVP